MSTYSDAVLALSPLAYYRMNDTSGTTIHDFSGNGKHATINVAGHTTFGATSLLNDDGDTATTFSAASGPVASTPDLGTPTNWTIAFWGQIPSNTLTYYLGWGDTYFSNNSSNYLTYNYNLSSEIGNTAGAHATFGVGQFYVINSGDAGIYINGVFHSTSTGQHPYAVHGQAYLAGFGGGSLAGQLDEVAFFNTKLTASQITELYNASFGPYGKATLDLGPSLYWRLDDPVSSTTVQDFSGNGYTGTVFHAGTGTVTFGTAGLIANDADTAMTLGGGSPAAAGISQNSYPRGTDSTVVMWVTPSVANQTCLLFTHNLASVWLKNGKLSDSLGANGTVTLQVGTTYQIIVTIHRVSSATTYNSYVNGVSDYSQTRSGNSAANNVFYLSRGYAGTVISPNTTFQGVIDEVSVFDSILSAGQVSALYSAGSIPPTPADAYTTAVLALSPVAYYPLNEITGTTVYDYSGNKHHGTITAPNNSGNLANTGVAQGQASLIPADTTNTCYHFNTSGLSLTLPVLPAAGSFSMIGWVYLYDYPSQNYHQLYNWGGLSVANGDRTNNTIWTSSGIDNNVSAQTNGPAMIPQDGNAHFLVMNSDRTVYMDGTYIGSTGGLPASPGGGDLGGGVGGWIGGLNNTSGYISSHVAHAKMQGVAFIPSVLSSSQVTTLYDAGNGVNVNAKSKAVLTVPALPYNSTQWDVRVTITSKIQGKATGDGSLSWAYTLGSAVLRTNSGTNIGSTSIVNPIHINAIGQSITTESIFEFVVTTPGTIEFIATLLPDNTLLQFAGTDNAVLFDVEMQAR